MTNVVKCPICKVNKAVPLRNTYIRCCGVLHSVEDNLVGTGVSRKSLISQKGNNDTIEDDEITFDVD